MFSNAKSSVCVVVLCALVASSFATPPSSTTMRSSGSQNGDNLFYDEGFGAPMQQFATEMGKTWRAFTQNAGWVFHNLEAIVRAAVEQGFVSVATWPVDIITRAELFTLANGSHFVFPLSGKSSIEQNYKIISVAVSKLMRNLKTMERTDKVLTNATKNLLAAQPEPHAVKEDKFTAKMFTNFLYSYFEAVNSQFEADEELGVEYKKQKEEAKQYVQRDPTVREPLLKIWEVPYKFVDMETIKSFVRDKQVLREAVANKVFLKQAVKHMSMIFNGTHYTRYLLSRALIQKAAESPTFECEVGEVYHQALVQAAGVVDVNVDDHVVADVLFNYIEKKLPTKNALYRDIQTIMKKVEASTVYDTDMFRIDFSPL